MCVHLKMEMKMVSVLDGVVNSPCHILRPIKLVSSITIFIIIITTITSLFRHTAKLVHFPLFFCERKML